MQPTSSLRDAAAAYVVPLNRVLKVSPDKWTKSSVFQLAVLSFTIAEFWRYSGSSCLQLGEHSLVANAWLAQGSRQDPCDGATLSFQI